MTEMFTRSPAGLALAGEALYGHRWQTSLARDLGVAPRTIRKWASGEKSIPPRQWRYIAALLNQRASDCKALASLIISLG